jgi:hypothetical protein
VQVRRLLVGLVGVLLTVASAAAEARDHHKTDRLIRAITLTREGAGSLISVTFVGHAHPHVLRSAEPLNAVALADVDHDGLLDIVAASNGQGLRLWRNAGRGHFVLAAPPLHFLRVIRWPGIREVRRTDERPVANDDGGDAAMPRAPAVGAPATFTPLFRSAQTFPTGVQRTTRSGRAPPTSSVPRSV